MGKENQSEERTTAELFSEYANLLWRWSWLLALLALLAGGTAYFVSRRGTPIYQSSTLVLVNGAQSSIYDSYYSLSVSQQLALTYAKIMTTQPKLDAVADRMGLAKFPPTASVQAQPVQDTQLLKVVVTDTDPERAAVIANTLISVFSDQIQSGQTTRYQDLKKNLEDQMDAINQQIENTTNALAMVNQQLLDTQTALKNVNELIDAITQKSGLEKVSDTDQNKQSQLQNAQIQYQSERAQLETTRSQQQQSYYYLLQSYEQIKLAEAQSISTIVQQESAIPQRSPIQPQPVRSATLAALFGLMLAAGIIFLIEFLDDSIRDPQEVTRRWGIPVLGTIISFNSSNGDALITVKQPRSPASEAFRSLRTNLQFASVDTPLRTVLVTSPSPSDGKTTIVANLGCVIAQSGRSVVVVDADLRRPRVHKIFQLTNRVGLTDQFIRTQDHSDGFLKSTEIANLHVITSGSLPPNPSELLGSGKMSEILRQLSEHFNTVIIDSPPVLAVTDALVLATRVDGVLLVVKPSITKRAAFKHAIEQLLQVKANLLGVIVNDVKVSRSRYYYYRRGYYNSDERKHLKGDNAVENDLEPGTNSDVTVPGDAVSRRPFLRNIIKKTNKKIK